MLQYFYIILIIWNWNETEFHDPKMKLDVGVLKALLKRSIHPPGSSTASPVGEGPLSSGNTSPSGGSWLSWAQWLNGDKEEALYRLQVALRQVLHHGWGRCVPGLPDVSANGVCQLLFSHSVLEKGIDSVHIHCIQINLTVLSSGNGCKSNMEGENPPKSYSPTLDLKNQKGDSWWQTLNEGIFPLVTPTHCKHCVGSITFTKDILNLELELDGCPEF